MNTSTPSVMPLQLPQLCFSKLMRAITEFQLIDDGDRVLVGISGGKDSIFLACALVLLQQRMKKNFELQALTINPQFDAAFDTERIAAYCHALGIPHAVRNVDIAGAIRGQGGKKACFTCAYFRRGAINRYAKESGCNKIAYAHHNDDAVGTFFMSLLYSGQLETFAPKTYLDRSNLTVIRPLIYIREQEIRDAMPKLGFRPVKSPCPYDGHTKRQTVKELISNMETKIPDLYAHLASAMRESAITGLWPPAKTRKDMQKTYFGYMSE